MKKLLMVILTAALFTGIGVQEASAENSLKKGTLGLSVLVNDTPLYSAKYLVMADLALLAGFGLNSYSGDIEGNDIIIGVGAHKYLKVSDFAPFFGGRISYASTQDNELNAFMLQAEAGAEVFLQKHLSVEGLVALGLSYTEDADLTYYRFGTTSAGISFNYYYQ